MYKNLIDVAGFKQEDVMYGEQPRKWGPRKGLSKLNTRYFRRSEYLTKLNRICFIQRRLEDCSWYVVKKLLLRETIEGHKDWIIKRAKVF